MWNYEFSASTTRECLRTTGGMRTSVWELTVLKYRDLRGHQDNERWREREVGSQPGPQQPRTHYPQCPQRPLHSTRVPHLQFSWCHSKACTQQHTTQSSLLQISPRPGVFFSHFKALHQLLHSTHRVLWKNWNGHFLGEISFISANGYITVHQLLRFDRGHQQT